MSEHSQPPTLPSAFARIDHTGTLFEIFGEEEPVLPEEASTFEEIVDPPPQERFHYPLTVEQQEARIKYNLARRAIGTLLDRDSPYGELGGHSPETVQDRSDANFELLVDNFQPWMRDIRLAFDRYGLNELTTDGIAAMTETDRRVLALHIDGFLDRVGAVRHLIKLADGEVRFYPQQLQKWYGEDRSKDEMVAYASLLKILTTTLSSTGVSQALHQAALSVSLKQNKREAVRRKDDEKYGHPQVVFDGIKPSIDRLPHHD